MSHTSSTGRKPITLTDPKRQTRTFRDPSRLPLPSDKRAPPPFLYAHMDSDWEYHPEHGFLPQLKRYPIVPGLNGVDEHSGDSSLRAGILAKGGIIIDRYDDRLLLDGEHTDDESHTYYDYVRYFETEDGRRYHVEPGEVPTITGRRAIVWDKDAGRRGYAAFRKHLRDSGIIDPITDPAWQDIRAHQTARIERLRDAVARNPHKAAALEAAEATLRAMTAEWERLTTEDEPARPVRVKRARKEAPDA
jgi:hypothetical protein